MSDMRPITIQSISLPITINHPAFLSSNIVDNRYDKDNLNQANEIKIWLVFSSQEQHSSTVPSL